MRRRLMVAFLSTLLVAGACSQSQRGPFVGDPPVDQSLVSPEVQSFLDQVTITRTRETQTLELADVREFSNRDLTGHERALLLERESQLLASLGLEDEAIAKLEEAALQPGLPQMRVYVFNGIAAERHILQGRCEAAIPLIDRIERRYPFTGSFRAGLFADVFMAVGRPADALTWARTAAAPLDRAPPYQLRQLAGVYEALGDHRAVAEMDRRVRRMGETLQPPHRAEDAYYWLEDGRPLCAPATPVSAD